MKKKKVKKLTQITRKSLLYRTKVEYGDFCINHVRGCSHGCNYPCYAMMFAKRYGQIKNYEEWITPKIVGNALELLDKEIPKYKKKIKFVHLCFSTDPFMYKQQEVIDLSLRIIEKLNKNKIRCTVLTKGVYPKKLTSRDKYSIKNTYGITLVSLDENFKKKMEPFSAPFRNRVKSLKRLHDAGLKTWVSMEPYPTPNLVKQDLEKILESISFVDKIIFGKLNYNIESSQSKNSKEFYQDCAEKVVTFCRQRGIKHHIKYGTRKKDDKKTKTIFSERKNIDKAKPIKLAVSV